MAEPASTCQAIQAQGLNRSFRGSPALRDVSFDLPNGRVLHILGGQGSGKTTLLRMAVGLMAPDSGTIRVFGEDPRTSSTQKRQALGYFPQRLELHPELTVRSHLDFVRRFYDSWNGELEAQILEDGGIDPASSWESLPAKNRRHIGLLFCLCQPSKLLILDTPTGLMDTKARPEMLDFMAPRLETFLSSDPERAILHATHHPDDVRRLGGDVLILDRGRVRLHGSVEELTQDCREIRIAHEGRPELPPLASVIATWQSSRDTRIVVSKLESEELAHLDHQFGKALSIRPLTLEECLDACTGRPTTKLRHRQSQSSRP